MPKEIYDIRVCPLARSCGNNSCLMRMVQVLNYPLEPSTDIERQKAAAIEKKSGKGYLPRMDTLFRGGSIQVRCYDYKDR